MLLLCGWIVHYIMVLSNQELEDHILDLLFYASLRNYCFVFFHSQGNPSIFSQTLLGLIHSQRVKIHSKAK